MAVLSFAAADDMAASAHQRAMMIAMVDGHGGCGSVRGYFVDGDERGRGRSEIDNKEVRRAVLVTARLFS